MTLAQISDKAVGLYEKYEVPERLSSASRAVTEGACAATAAAKRGADVAYRAALNHPRSAIGGAILAAALIGGALWYLFGRGGEPVQRRTTHKRVRAGGAAERRKRARHARAAAA